MQGELILGRPLKSDTRENVWKRLDLGLVSGYHLIMSLTTFPSLLLHICHYISC